MGVDRLSSAPLLGTEAVDARTPPLRQRIQIAAWGSTRSDLWATSVVVVALVVAAALSWKAWGDISIDTGYDMLAAKRVAGGDLPYADFQYFYGVLPLGLLALAFVVFGSSIGVAVGFGLVVASLIVLGTYVMVRCVAGPLRAAIAAALVVGPAFAATNNSYVMPHTVSATVGTLLLIWLVIVVSRWVITLNAAYALVAGALIGCLALTRPEFWAAGVAGSTLLLAVRWRSHVLRRNEVIAVVLPAIAVPGIVLGAFLTQMSANALVFENLWPRAQLAAGSDVVLRIHAPLTVGSFVSLGGALLAYLALCAALVLVATGARHMPRKQHVVALTVALAFAFGIGLSRPETARFYLNYAYKWIPLGVGLVAFVVGVRLLVQRSTPTAERQIDAFVLVALSVLASMYYAVFLPLGPIAQPAVYFMPFMAYFLVRLHLDFLGSRFDARALGTVWLLVVAIVGGAVLLRDGWRERPVTGPGGSIGAPVSEREGFQAAVNWIDSSSASGDKVLIAPQLAILSFLADRPAPHLRQLNLIPSALPTPADERAVIARLDDERVRVALIDRRPYPAYGYAGFGTGFYFEIEDWLKREFRRDATFVAGGRQLEGWVRR